MAELNMISDSSVHTRKIGTLIGRMVRPGDVILLTGRLGSGKTCLTQGIARGMGIRDYASSPSFVIMRELYGRFPLYHMDLYRLECREEISDLGLDDYLYGNGVSVVEWADNGLSLLPVENLLIEMSYCEGSQRNICLIPHGSHYEEMLARLKGIYDGTGRNSG